MRKRLMPKIIVYVRGGVIHDIVANTDEVEAMVVDYDDEECEEAIRRSFAPVRCDLGLFSQTVAGIEPA